MASVSCIYGLGSPSDYDQQTITLKVGDTIRRDRVLRHLIDIQYDRNDMTLVRGTFRVRGDTLELYPAYEDLALRVEFFGDEIERIVELDALTGEILSNRQETVIYPARHFVTTAEKLAMALNDIEDELEEHLEDLNAQGKVLEAARVGQRTRYDIEMLTETGFCAGVENYSRHLARREPGQQPWTLLDYFPSDWLLFVDESHISLPQVRGMYAGDQSRKNTLIEHGFRLPSARDNRPLTFDEFQRQIDQVIYVSATPGPFEMEHSEAVIEQVIRPTGLVDPEIFVRPTKGQIDDLLEEVHQRVARGERALVTTLTKKMAEDLSDFLKEMGIRTHYLHSEIDTLERVEILRDLRLGVYDVVVGINLLREGLDLPEVSLVAILDADKEGYLRSTSSLIQIVGRAARHVEGQVVMYADRVTRSMQDAIDETYRRREIQLEHNERHGIEPRTIVKEIRDITDRVKQAAEQSAEYDAAAGKGGIIAEIPPDELARLIKDLERQMKQASQQLEFERAAMLRDQIIELRRVQEVGEVGIG
ncbi:MAG: excinuclease ABC subunit UvrB [Thermomicrobiales bacterium]